MDVMTRGFNDLVAQPGRVARWAAKWAVAAKAYIRPRGKPDMVIGRPKKEPPHLEDDGRTLVLPVPQGVPRLYACVNETGGITFMLAEEY